MALLVGFNCFLLTNFLNVVNFYRFMTIIKSNRLVLRPLKDKDEVRICELGNNKKIWLNLSNRFPHPYTIKKAREWINFNKEKKETMNFAITINDELIGMIGCDYEQEYLECGYWIGEPYWGKGYAKEALFVFLKHLFENFNVMRVQAKVFTHNIASCKVLEKFDFKKEGVLRKTIKKENKFLDEFVYSLLRDEFLKMLEKEKNLFK